MIGIKWMVVILTMLVSAFFIYQTGKNEGKDE